MKFHLLHWLSRARFHCFRIPENETLSNLALALAMFLLTCALLIIIWQAELVAYQRALIWDLFRAVYSK